MAIVITKADVKRKCMIAASDTTCDSPIDSLIAEMQPALEYGIDQSYLTDTSNSGLQAALKLGILEAISGEFLQQRCREVGATEEFVIAGMTLGESKDRGASLLQQGAERLKPFLKVQTAESEIRSTTQDKERVLSDSSVW